MMGIEEELRAMTRDDHGVRFVLRKDEKGDWRTDKVEVFISEWAMGLGVTISLIAVLRTMGVEMPSFSLPGWDFPFLSALGGVGEGIQTTFGTVEREFTPAEEELQILLDAETMAWKDEGMPAGIHGLSKRHKAIRKEYEGT